MVSTMKKSSSAPVLHLVFQRISFWSLLPESVRRSGGATKLFFVFLTLFFFTFFSLVFSRYAIRRTDLGFLPANPMILIKNLDSFNEELPPVVEKREQQIAEADVMEKDEAEEDLLEKDQAEADLLEKDKAEADDMEKEQADEVRPRHVSSVTEFVKYKSESILFPAWEVLVIVSPEAPPLSEDLFSGFRGGDDGGGGGDHLYCLFSDNATSEARFAGVLPFTKQTAFKCEMPMGTRRRMPYLQPILTINPAAGSSPAKEEYLIRINFCVYESLSTEDDVVLFVKGLNNRQGINRNPDEFKCVFVDENTNTTVKTAVTSSVQEVFRCSHPDLTAFPGLKKTTNIKLSLEIAAENRAVPSVAYYDPGPATRRKIANEDHKKLLCACTMVYNVAKFLREWVTYHSSIGVQRFILYDNDSDDNLTEVVDGLNRDGFNVTTLLWLWPKTQEAGFSHNAVNSNHTCSWMMYLDVDEFVFSPSWINASQPSINMLRSLLVNSSPPLGEVSFRCNDFGPSGHVSNPAEGVTQGYTCHKFLREQRHKSIVLLEAIDESLVNVVHHFRLKKEYRWKQLGVESALVNHYKYQAWTEFKAKFRRRVSAYVVDWRETVNPMSKDRTPGLGFEPSEPKGWSNMFCDIRDDRLKLLTRRWFHDGFKMIRQT